MQSKHSRDHFVSSRKLPKSHQLVSALLTWFATNARDLPWRRTRDPYAIWVSEIMLQQTQVKTVIPYWERWMSELPTIQSLANAKPDKIHKLWEGLGYYTRVRNMQKAAQQIIASQPAVAADVSPLHLKAARRQSRLTPAATIQVSGPQIARSTRSPADGERDGVRGFPTTFDAVLALPGIGRYTAGAICSIAFNQPTPILDGNVIRVLTRIHGIKTDPREKRTNARLWQLAEELVTQAKTENKGRDSAPRCPDAAAHHPPYLGNSCSHLNQSLMELGALICTPRSPNCPACPVQRLCIAHKENLQEQIPNVGMREATTARHFIAFVVERNGKFLVRQRPAGVVNAHLWEFPNIEVATSAGEARQSFTRRLGSEESRRAWNGAPYPNKDFTVTDTKPLRVIKHSITRYRITLEAWRAELYRNTPGRRPALRGSFLSLEQLHQLAFTSAHKKIVAALTQVAQGCNHTRPRK